MTKYLGHNFPVPFFSGTFEPEARSIQSLYKASSRKTYKYFMDDFYAQLDDPRYDHIAEYVTSMRGDDL